MGRVWRGAQRRISILTPLLCQPPCYFKPPFILNQYDRDNRGKIIEWDVFGAGPNGAIIRTTPDAHMVELSPWPSTLAPSHPLTLAAHPCTLTSRSLTQIAHPRTATARLPSAGKRLNRGNQFSESVLAGCVAEARKVDIRLPGKWNSSSHGARPVRQIISMMEWTRTSRLSIKYSLSVAGNSDIAGSVAPVTSARERGEHRSTGAVN